MNTRDNRASAIALGLPAGRTYWLPDGAVTQGDRQHVTLSYRGILAGALMDARVQFSARADAQRFAANADSQRFVAKVDRTKFKVLH